MKTHEIPQDKIKMMPGETKAIYGLGKDNKYTTASTTGWVVEDIANSQAVAELNTLAEDARQRMQAGSTSPIEYYMYKNRLDVMTLAQYMGMFQWIIKRHFRPEIFRKLPEKVLKKYADIFSIDVKELRS